jgi:hypothetical protein
MKVHHIILLLWVIVFAFWAFNQVAESNRRKDRELRRRTNDE